MTPHSSVLGVWAELAAVREVQEAFGLKGRDGPEEYLWQQANVVAVQFLNGSTGYNGPLYMVRSKDRSDPINLLVRPTGHGFVAVAGDEDVSGCREPICSGEFKLIWDEKNLTACANASCPNYERWPV